MPAGSNCRIVIVDAFDVAFRIPRRHELSERDSRQLFSVARLVNCSIIRRVTILLADRMIAIGQILAAIDLVDFPKRRPGPRRRGRASSSLIDRSKKFVPLRWKNHSTVFDDGRQIERLGVDGKLVFAELDDRFGHRQTVPSCLATGGRHLRESSSGDFGCRRL